MAEREPIGQVATVHGPNGSGRSRLVGIVTGIAGVGLGGILALALVVALLATSVEGCSFDLSGLSDIDLGPGPGRDSEQLPVAVEPAEGLTDGATVFVTSEAFDPYAIVSIGLCLEEAATERKGAEACDTDAGQRFAVAADGTLTAVVAVPRVITVGGEAHDCAAAPKRCLLVAADANDYDRSGGEPLAFAPGLPPVELVPGSTRRASTVLLPVTLAPSGPTAAGTEITATVTGLMPGEPVIAGFCTGAFLQVGLTACDPIGGDAIAAVFSRSVEQVHQRADGAGSIAYAATAPAVIEPFTGDPVDCTTAPGRCVLVVGAAADPQRSAYVPLTVSG